MEKKLFVMVFIYTCISIRALALSVTTPETQITSLIELTQTHDEPPLSIASSPIRENIRINIISAYLDAYISLSTHINIYEKLKSLSESIIKFRSAWIATHQEIFPDDDEESPYNVVDEATHAHINIMVLDQSKEEFLEMSQSTHTFLTDLTERLDDQFLNIRPKIEQQLTYIKDHFAAFQLASENILAYCNQRIVQETDGDGMKDFVRILPNVIKALNTYRSTIAWHTHILNENKTLAHYLDPNRISRLQHFLIHDFEEEN